MRILDANSNIIFTMPKNILEYVDQIKSTLGKKYEVAQIGNDLDSIDDEIINEIPLVIAHMGDGKQIIEFCNNKVKISINFDEKMDRNISDSIGYIKDIIHIIFSILCKIDGIEFRFSGVYCTIINEEITDPLKLLTGSLTKKVSAIMDNKKVYDCSSKMTFINDDVHFINIKLSNIRGNLQVDNQSDLMQRVNCLSIELDINDRYGFNEVENYKSSVSAMDKNLELLDEIVFQKIEGIISL